MCLTLAVFENKFTEFGKIHECSSIEDILRTLKPRKVEKKDQLPILRLINKRHRSSKTFTGLVIDLDGKTKSHTIDDIQAAFANVNHIAYETFNSSQTQRRWRVIFPASQSFDAVIKQNALQALNELTQLDIDPSSIKNLEIGQYAPGNETGDTQLHISINQTYDILSWPALLTTMESLARLEQKSYKQEDHQLQLDSLWNGSPVLVSSYTEVRELWLDPSVQLHIAHTIFGLSPRLFRDFSLARSCSSKTFRSPISGHFDKHPSCSLLYQISRKTPSFRSGI